MQVLSFAIEFVVRHRERSDIAFASIESVLGRPPSYFPEKTYKASLHSTTSHESSGASMAERRKDAHRLEARAVAPTKIHRRPHSFCREAFNARCEVLFNARLVRRGIFIAFREGLLHSFPRSESFPLALDS